MEILNSKKGLELVDNDSELYKVLIDTFITESKFEPSELEKLVAEGKLSEAAGYVHAVKGAGRQIGTERLAASGQKLEDVLRGKATGDIKKLTAEVLEEYKMAIEVVKKF